MAPAMLEAAPQETKHVVNVDVDVDVDVNADADADGER